MPTSPELESHAEFEPRVAFDPAVVSAVLAHMNSDHAADNLLIARGSADSDARLCRSPTGHARVSAAHRPRTEVTLGTR